LIYLSLDQRDVGWMCGELSDDLLGSPCNPKQTKSRSGREKSSEIVEQQLYIRTSCPATVLITPCLVWSYGWSDQIGLKQNSTCLYEFAGTDCWRKKVGSAFFSVYPESERWIARLLDLGWSQDNTRVFPKFRHGYWRGTVPRMLSSVQVQDKVWGVLPIR